MHVTSEFLEAVQNREPIAGYTHDFYRYPARFSPLFAREAIRTFTRPGDTVLDPFMGGGTTLVEAYLQGRNAVGTDLSSLAVFLAQVKTTALSEADLNHVSRWGHSLENTLNLHNPPVRDWKWIRLGYQRNVSTKTTWPIRKTLELAMARVTDLTNVSQRRFARCVLLKTAQWALDCRTELPSARELRKQFKSVLDEMIVGARCYAEAVRTEARPETTIACRHRSAVGLESDGVWNQIPRPRLVITSPPYPGVDVLYHRWQIQGRRETPAPFWIADTLDGCGASFYTFGDRKQHGLAKYYAQARAAFRSLAHIADRETMIVQMVAFSEPEWQLPNYLTVLRESGFQEVKSETPSNNTDGRLWRTVPNRKWYASQRGVIGASNEVVLFHKLPTS